MQAAESLVVRRTKVRLDLYLQLLDVRPLLVVVKVLVKVMRRHQSLLARLELCGQLLRVLLLSLERLMWLQQLHPLKVLLLQRL